MRHAEHPTIRLALSLLAVAFILSACDRLPEGDPQLPESASSLDLLKRQYAVDLGLPHASASSLRPAFSLTSLSTATTAATATPIPFAPEPGPFANVVPLGDDQTSGLLPIGFQFVFFDQTYTHFNISSNGFIGFDEFMGHGCCSGRLIPSADDINNIVAVAWTDLFPPGGGEIAFETRGEAPNRRLIVSFESLPWFPEFGVNRVTAQAILYEGSNLIEIHATHVSPGHIYTQGVENRDGTAAAFLEGRVAANFGLDSDAVQFRTASKRVAIDIRPGSDANTIRPGQPGLVSVAILSTQAAEGEIADFDATTVDPSSVRFGPDGAPPLEEPKPELGLRDVDQDGDVDLVLRFDVAATGIRQGDTEACLTGSTVSNEAFLGCDAIRTVGGQAPPRPSGVSATPIQFAPEPGPFGNVLPLGDDQTSGLLPIGFEFIFFGNTYTQFNVSSNGFIGFDAFMSQGCCTGRPIPSDDDVNNVIAAAWTDLFPPGGGQISWETRGRGPRRRLIVNFESLPWFPEFGVNRVTTQVILYEGTNTIEVHTTHQSPGHIYTQGVENADGTLAAFLPGRVAADYGLENDAVRFTTDVRERGRVARECPAVADFVVRNQFELLDALNAASPGDVIALDGMIELSFSEVFVQKDDLTLTCATPGSGLRAAPFVGISWLSIVTSKRVTVERLTLDATHTFNGGFLAFNGEEAFTGFAEDVRFVRNRVLCAVHHLEACVSIRSGVHAGLQGALVAGNTVESNGGQAAVHLQGVRSARVEGNTIEATAPSGDGLRVNASEEIVVAENVVLGAFANSVFFLGGVFLSRVERNRIEGAREDPLVLFGAEGVQVSRNVVECGPSTCAFLAGSPRALVADNYFEAPRSLSGIHLQTGTDGTQVLRNTVVAIGPSTDPAFGGIRVRDGSAVLVFGNRISGPWTNSIAPTDLTESRIEGNELEGAASFGLRFATGVSFLPVSMTSNAVTSNRITGAGTAAILAHLACDNTFVGNNLQGNAENRGAIFDETTGANAFAGNQNVVIDNGSFDCDGDNAPDPNVITGQGAVQNGVNLGKLVSDAVGDSKGARLR